MKSDLFLDLKKLTEHHAEACNLYRSYVETLFPNYKSATSCEQLPWVPVRAFKNFELYSVPKGGRHF